MPVTYNDTVANARLTVARDAIDQGAGPGKLVIGTSALAGATGVLVEIPFADPSGSVAARVLTLSGMPKEGTAIANGTAAKVEIRDSNNVVIVSDLTVGVSGSGANIIINTTAIVTNQIVQLLSGTITHP